jgi:Fic-DOC domain mobile mystery protein B
VSGLDDQPDDATPLTPEEREGLIPSHVAFRRELNELEQQNIIEADTWAFSRKRNPMTEAFVRSLHRRMFGKVWKWAGTYRTSNKNIGVERWQVQPRLAEALEQARYWAEHKTYPPDEIAVRVHHALVFIHPFPNGNGRWSRLMADLLVVRLGQPRFTWGRSALRAPDETRRAYIDSLKAADNHDFGLLLAFARS